MNRKSCSAKCLGPFSHFKPLLMRVKPSILRIRHGTGWDPIYTSSSERAERLGRAIRTGLVWVNTFAVRDLKVPFGGTGISGIGREGGGYALDFYSDLKALLIREGSTE